MLSRSTRKLGGLTSSARFYSALEHTGAFKDLHVPPGSVIFSLIQPTGKLHLGNYLGAIREWKELADKYGNESTTLYGTADLHALTVPKESSSLRAFRQEAIASLLAGGVDPSKSVIFHQSSVPEHAELTWILTCLVSLGSLNRMTQWKLKSKQAESSSIFNDQVMGKTKAGLLCYPILQAADVLIYKTTHVPVGKDQAQHLELTRDLSNLFNHHYNVNYFPSPQTLLSSGKKILSLRDPSKKMSKSDADKNSCVYITDEPDVISRKLRKAVTDSIQGSIYYDPRERPGISNLIDIVAGLRSISIDDAVADLSWMKDHKQLKDYVTELLVEEFKETRHLYLKLMDNRDYLADVCREGSLKAREIALKNMQQIKKHVGLD